MLDTSILQQVTEIFRNLEGNYTFRINYAPQREESNQLLAFLNDFASTSSHLNLEKHEVDGETLSFTLLKNGEHSAAFQKPAQHQNLQHPRNQHPAGENIQDSAI